MSERGFAFHQWTPADLKRHFDVDFKEGLSQKRAHFRLLKNGRNSLVGLKETGGWAIFLRQFGNIFIVLLFAAAVISYFVDGIIQSLILVGIIILNISLGFFQEFSAQKALSDLKQTFISKCKVLRDGKFRIIPSEELVVGDIVAVDGGDRVPADLRIIECESLSADESALTGESLPVAKSVEAIKLDAALGDRKNMLFGSTTIASGRGKGIVVGTGRETEFGKIAGLVESAKEDKTPLEKQIISLGKTLTILSLVIVIAIFILGYAKGFEIFTLLTLTIALLVGAVPESLPTVITLSMAIGVSRMAKRKAIVRKLAVVETLGTVNVIATDKTGTLTNNELSVGKVAVFGNNVLTPYAFDSEPSKEAVFLLEKGVVCSNIDLKDESGEILGDPVEVAIAESAKKMRLGIITKSRLYKRDMEIPFDSEKQYMAVNVSLRGEREIIVKGSTEKVLSFCKVSASEKKLILSESAKYSADGYKVIALATKKLSSGSAAILSSMDFSGLFALIDEPVADVGPAIKDAIKAGIRPIMITGDHPETARFIAEKVGIEVSDDEILTGRDLEDLSESELKKHLSRVKVFARITPEDKINIVRLLRKTGYSVAVTGDGINDAPALKEANVGIAMGIKGTDVAKDSSDVVLLDDKFGTIISAVEYGRAIFDNIRNAIIFLLSGNIDELFLIGFAFLFDLPLPLLTIQILWINMITDSLPAMALAFEKPSATVLNEKPRPTNSDSMNRPIIYSLCLSLVLFFLGLILYLWGLGSSVDKARTLIFTFSVFSELAYCFSIRAPERIWQNAKGFFANKFLLVTIFTAILFQLAIFIGPLRRVFSIVPLNSNEICALAVATLIAFFAAELIRAGFDKKIERF